ncbi:NAD(P)-binding protein [Zychaea mexicana]|uniref:NAD(P)-binding protein n=1 Tax=Zychaea mexicana TaxID=64656 RepID=UPI0022FDD91A|nr:NAD(P)-binding protein [Zychaea mexicana]KAI9484826.1 NAD(P)-binding protein [Zychaea mexicana]
MGGRVAIVFGANGISGVALLTQLIQAPASEWSKIIAISRRPPQLEFDDPRVVFASVDILKVSVQEFAKILTDHGAKEAQHAFHYTYIEKPTDQELVDVNTELLSKALNAIAAVNPPRFETFVLQTGYKYYGNVHGPPYLAKKPFLEDAPRSDVASNFYYPQEDLTKSICQEHEWRWIISRPNTILGVSKGNFMNFAVSLAIYASLQKSLGRKLGFPGCKEQWNAKNDFSTATNNADFQVWASLNKQAGNNAFNTADGPKTQTRDLWHKIAEYFGLEVVADDEVHNLDIKAFDYATWAFVDTMMARGWEDDGSHDKMRKFGWNKTVDSIQSFYNIFDKLKEMNIIPK